MICYTALYLKMDHPRLSHVETLCCRPQLILPQQILVRSEALYKYDIFAFRLHLDLKHLTHILHMHMLPNHTKGCFYGQ